MFPDVGLHPGRDSYYHTQYLLYLLLGDTKATSDAHRYALWTVIEQRNQPYAWT
jgi:hypothetical protein